jgi:Na+/Pi-cotransporter
MNLFSTCTLFFVTVGVYICLVNYLLFIISSQNQFRYFSVLQKIINYSVLQNHNLFLNLHMTDLEKDDLVAEEQAVDGTPVATEHGEEDGRDATWSDVCRTCFCHPPIVWAMIVFRLFWVLFFLFFFILGLEILGDGAQVLTGCVAGALFGDDQNPVSSLMIGILVTCLLQSSSTTTSIIVTLTGAGAVSVEQGIYMVFGGTYLVSLEYLASHCFSLTVMALFFFSQYRYFRDEYNCCNGSAWRRRST